MQSKSPSFIQEKKNVQTEIIICISIPSALCWEAEGEKYRQALAIPRQSMEITHLIMWGLKPMIYFYPQSLERAEFVGAGQF